MKVTVVSRSDSNGGAAIVSRRLTEALRELGIRAGMLVLDKKTDLPFVVEVHYPIRQPFAFMEERAQIFLHNGMKRKNLWKVDTAAFGLPLSEHPMVREADAIILNWVNQGMLSLEGIRRMSPPGKRVIWTMHDMWNLTGICHHAMDCRRYEGECGKCPLLNSHKEKDLSRTTWLKKEQLYRDTRIRFVAVSSWLAEKARESSLMKERDVTVIPNPFEPRNTIPPLMGKEKGVRILFAAATLDNWIKGLTTFREAVGIFKERHPDLARQAKVVLMGAVKNPSSTEGFALPVEYLGSVTGEDKLAEVYSRCDVTVNSSYFENLPGTLIESQAYGAVPVAFDRGGQRDIIDDGETGILAPWHDREEERAASLADAIARALKMAAEDPEGTRERMRRSVEERFSYKAVARQYLDLLENHF